MKNLKNRIFFSSLFFVIVFSGCKKNDQVNKVNLNQINHDNSNNYRYLFKEEIAKERRRKKYERLRIFTK